MENKKIEITASQLIDMKQSDFEYFVKEGHMPLGEASNLKFFLSGQYQQVVLQKDAVVKKMMNAKTAVESHGLEHHIENLYMLLLDLEKKVAFLNEYINCIIE